MGDGEGFKLGVVQDTGRPAGWAPGAAREEMEAVSAEGGHDGQVSMGWAGVEWGGFTRAMWINILIYIRKHCCTQPDPCPKPGDLHSVHFSCTNKAPDGGQMRESFHWNSNGMKTSASRA